MPPLQNLALVFVFVLGALLIGWYLVGNEVMRRRGRSLAVWCKRSLDPLGGRQAIQWITTQSFRLEVEGLKAPFVAGSLAVLSRSMNVPERARLTPDRFSQIINRLARALLRFASPTP